MIARIYYGDDFIYVGDAAGSPSGKEHDGVQYIVSNDPAKGPADLGRVVLSEWDIYMYSSDLGWHGTNKYADLLMHLEDGKVERVLIGKWINGAKYQAMGLRAWNDPGLDRKSATDPLREVGRE